MLLITCAIPGCDSKCTSCENSEGIPMYSLPKNTELQNKWFQNIDSTEVNQKLKQGWMICIKHFENNFVRADKSLMDKAIPTLNLKSGSTLVDFEELLTQKAPAKKKRGTSGLMNLQIARKKKLIRRERMQKLAEKRRKAKLELLTNPKVAKKKSEMVKSANIDYFLSEQNETDAERLIISLRLTNLMPHLHDDKIIFCKHPSSIRDSKVYPIFNGIKNKLELLDNPILWTKKQALIFVDHIMSSKSVTKKFESQEIDGEALLNMTKSDLFDILKLDENSSEILSNAFSQLRKETIMRYVNS